MPVKIIESSSASSLEKKINDYLLECGELIDIKYSMCEYNQHGSSQHTTFSALILYE